MTKTVIRIVFLRQAFEGLQTAFVISFKISISVLVGELTGASRYRYAFGHLASLQAFFNAQNILIKLKAIFI